VESFASIASLVNSSGFLTSITLLTSALSGRKQNRMMKSGGRPKASDEGYWDEMQSHRGLEIQESTRMEG
jgi:hypothetical protein